jgi:hypothetical protein
MDLPAVLSVVSCRHFREIVYLEKLEAFVFQYDVMIGF